MGDARGWGEEAIILAFAGEPDPEQYSKSNETAFASQVLVHQFDSSTRQHHGSFQ